MRFLVPLGALGAMSCNLEVVFPNPIDTGSTVEDSDPPADTSDTAPTTGDTGPYVWEHDLVAPDQLCWDCHEAERPAPEHWDGDLAIELRWDCAPCHTTVGWADAAWNHPVKTPHGTYGSFTPTAPTDWIVACVSCHPAEPVYTEADCVTCHLASEPDFELHYGLDLSDPDAATTQCLGCHEAGNLF